MIEPQYIWDPENNDTNCVVPKAREIAKVIACGCWVITLAHGKAVLLCATHEPQVMPMIDPRVKG